MIIDQTTDPGYATLRALVVTYPQLQKLAASAEISDEEFEKLSEDSFAWPDQRRFPIYTKEQTLLSLGYRKLASKVPADVDALLEKAAELYDIPVDEIFAEPQGIKTATEEHWLLPEKKRFRVTDKNEVKIAETVLREKYAQLSIEDRAEAFHNLGKVAKELGVTLSPSTSKLAGFTITSTRILKDWLEARKTASVGDVIKQTYQKIADECSNTSPYIRDRYTQIKLASAIHELDKEAGLDKFYGKKLPDPIQTVFNTEKRAEDEVSVGQDFAMDKQTLGNIPLTFWQDVLGEDIAKEVSTPEGGVNIDMLQQILPTLPADLTPIIQSQLGAYK
jgi:hypothetical protein